MPQQLNATTINTSPRSASLKLRRSIVILEESHAPSQR
jgi:hypothetical protein